MDDAIGKHLLGALEDVNDRRLGVNCGGCSSSRVELIRDVRVSVLKIAYYSRHRLIGSLIMQLMGSNLTRFSSPKLLL
jgi:hypothetical protein